MEGQILHAFDGPVFYELLDCVEGVLPFFTDVNSDPARVMGAFRIVKKIDDFRFNVLT
jgi:hypothetical protein